MHHGKKSKGDDSHRESDREKKSSRRKEKSNKDQEVLEENPNLSKDILEGNENLASIYFEIIQSLFGKKNVEHSKRHVLNDDYSNGANAIMNPNKYVVGGVAASVAAMMLL